MSQQTAPQDGTPQEAAGTDTSGTAAAAGGEPVVEDTTSEQTAHAQEHSQAEGDDFEE
ncbi:hypothetical protein [Peterkaempfera griseoplana]|uniref:hypothetical protein n=1 Tax=Peterkaempfera griseoplana TaxID=66896 RepID=UPI000A97162D|nr:hypothetical protein [Peterkaempfera griseoplana]